MSQAEALLDDIVTYDKGDETSQVTGDKSIVLNDTETGENYALAVKNGKLTMTEVPYNIVDQTLKGHIVIGTDRYIIIPDELKKIAVQHDHNIETVTFDCPRYWDEHDMSKMKIYINYLRPDDVKGSDLAKNVVVDAVDENIMHFDWTITGHMTEIPGPITFLICIQKVASDGTTSNHWNSELSIGEMYVSQGLECEETIVSIYPGIITSLLTRMDEAEENLLTWMRETDTNLANWKTSTYKALDDRMKIAEGNTTPTEILRRINECLDSNTTTQQVIYNSVTEYLRESTALSEEVTKQVAAYLDENLAEAAKDMINLTSLETIDKSAVITPTVEGNVLIESISGDSYQASDPSPDNPQEIENVGAYDDTSGKYAVEVKYSNTDDSVESAITLYLDEPLRKNDTICQKDGVLGVERHRAVIASYNGEPIDTDYMSTTGGLDIGATVEYTLAEPIFTPFEDQISFYNLMAFNEVTYVSIIDGSENTMPVATMRFPKYTDGGILLTDYAERKKKEIEVAAELERCFQSVSDGKALVASAITDKRVPTDATATFAQMAANIMKIVLGSGNATAGDVLAGKTFTNDDGVEYTGTLALSGNAAAGNVLNGKTFYNTDPKNKVTGTMGNNGAVSQALNCGGSYTIPAGYHNGSGKVTANSLSSQTSATAAAANITSGKTAWVNGVKVTGTRPVPITRQTGSLTTKVEPTQTNSVIVNFNTAFDKIPTVTAVITKATNSAGLEALNSMSISTSNVTRTSFVVKVKNGYTDRHSNATVDWTAQA